MKGLWLAVAVALLAAATAVEVTVKAVTAAEMEACLKKPAIDPQRLFSTADKESAKKSGGISLVIGNYGIAQLSQSCTKFRTPDYKCDPWRELPVKFQGDGDRNNWNEEWKVVYDGGEGHVRLQGGDADLKQLTALFMSKERNRHFSCQFASPTNGDTKCDGKEVNIYTKEAYDRNSGFAPSDAQRNFKPRNVVRGLAQGGEMHLADDCLVATVQWREDRTSQSRPGDEILYQNVTYKHVILAKLTMLPSGPQGARLDDRIQSLKDDDPNLMKILQGISETAPLNEEAVKKMLPPPNPDVISYSYGPRPSGQLIGVWNDYVVRQKCKNEYECSKAFRTIGNAMYWDKEYPAGQPQGVIVLSKDAKTVTFEQVRQPSLKRMADGRIHERLPPFAVCTLTNGGEGTCSKNFPTYDKDPSSENFEIEHPYPVFKEGAKVDSTIKIVEGRIMVKAYGTSGSPFANQEHSKDSIFILGSIFKTAPKNACLSKASVDVLTKLAQSTTKTPVYSGAVAEFQKSALSSKSYIWALGLTKGMIPQAAAAIGYMYTPEC